MHHPIWRYASGEGNSRGLYIKYLCEAPVFGSLAFCFSAKPCCGFPSVFHNQLINIIMLKKTISYETPDMKVFEMHPESGMLTVTSPIYGEEGEAGADGYLTIIGEDY